MVGTQKNIEKVKSYFEENPKKRITPTELAAQLRLNHYAVKDAISYLEQAGYIEVSFRGMYREVWKKEPTPLLREDLK